MRGPNRTGAMAARGAGLMAVTATLTLGVAGPVGASGFQLKEQGAEGLGNAYAGATAKAYDPSTAFWNPAGMTRLSGNHAAMSATIIMPGSSFSGTATTTRGTAVAGPMGGDAAVDTVVPSLYGVFSLTDDLKLGLAVNVPFGMSTKYPDNWVGRYQALRSELQATSLSPSVAYRITDDLSFGIGPVVQYSTVTLTSAINNAGLLPGDGRSKVSGDDVGFGVAVGGLWEIDEGTRVGVSYRSQVQHTFEGDATYSNVHPALAAARGLVNSDASADLTTPDVVSVGVYHDIDEHWAVVADAAWTNWSVFKELRVETDVGADPVT